MDRVSTTARAVCAKSVRLYLIGARTKILDTPMPGKRRTRWIISGQQIPRTLLVVNVLKYRR
jgi:hypothetical protein